MRVSFEISHSFSLYPSLHHTIENRGDRKGDEREIKRKTEGR
jgi:hypothetical protein